MVERSDHKITSMERLLKTLKGEKLVHDADHALFKSQICCEIAKELFANQLKNSNFKLQAYK